MASSSRLKPGERGRFTARLNTKGMRGMVLKTVEVLSNDPERPKVVLTIRADVKAPGTPSPPGN